MSEPIAGIRIPSTGLFVLMSKWCPSEAKVGGMEEEGLATGLRARSFPNSGGRFMPLLIENQM
jgi:hypothetical protein